MAKYRSRNAKEEFERLTVECAAEKEEEGMKVCKGDKITNI